MSSTHVSGSGESPSTDHTCIGVDLGVNRLITAAPAGGTLGDAFVVDGSALRDAVADLTGTQRRLQDTAFTTAQAEREAFAADWLHTRSIVIEAAVRAVRYAEQYANPVLIVEWFAPNGHTLWEWRAERGNHSPWLLPTLLEALELRAEEHGIPVETTGRDGTSRECHRCGKPGTLLADSLQCSTPSCPVDEVCRDRSAALTIAERGQRQLTE